MSLTHILKTARKLGIPVVITNDRGKSPQVVMPFEDFASMVNGTNACLRHSCEECACDIGDFDDEDEEDEDDDEEEGMPSIEEMNRWAQEAMDEEIPEIDPEEIKEFDKKHIQANEIVVEPVVQSKESEAKEAVEPTSVSLEDQFYFEPIQDKGQD